MIHIVKMYKSLVLVMMSSSLLDKPAIIDAAGEDGKINHTEAQKVWNSGGKEIYDAMKSDPESYQEYMGKVGIDVQKALNAIGGTIDKATYHTQEHKAEVVSSATVSGGMVMVNGQKYPRAQVERWAQKGSAAAVEALGGSSIVSKEGGREVHVATKKMVNTLEIGQMTPAGIKNVQEFLRNQGYKITIDGNFGGRTRGLLQDFQRKNGLNDSGQLDVATIAKIKEVNKTVQVAGYKGEIVDRKSYQKAVDTSADKTMASLVEIKESYDSARMVAEMHGVMMGVAKSTPELDKLYREINKTPGAIHKMAQSLGVAQVNNANRRRVLVGKLLETAFNIGGFVTLGIDIDNHKLEKLNINVSEAKAYIDAMKVGKNYTPEMSGAQETMTDKFTKYLTNLETLNKALGLQGLKGAKLEEYRTRIKGGQKEAYYSFAKFLVSEIGNVSGITPNKKDAVRFLFWTINTNKNIPEREEFNHIKAKIHNASANKADMSLIDTYVQQLTNLASSKLQGDYTDAEQSYWDDDGESGGSWSDEKDMKEAQSRMDDLSKITGNRDVVRGLLEKKVIPGIPGELTVRRSYEVGAVSITLLNEFSQSVTQNMRLKTVNRGRNKFGEDLFKKYNGDLKQWIANMDEVTPGENASTLDHLSRETQIPKNILSGMLPHAKIMDAGAALKHLGADLGINHSRKGGLKNHLYANLEGLINKVKGDSNGKLVLVDPDGPEKCYTKTVGGRTFKIQYDYKLLLKPNCSNFVEVPDMRTARITEYRRTMQGEILEVPVTDVYTEAPNVDEAIHVTTSQKWAAFIPLAYLGGGGKKKVDKGSSTPGVEGGPMTTTPVTGTGVPSSAGTTTTVTGLSGGFLPPM